METWRVVIEGKGKGGHVERFFEVKGFADLARAVAKELKSGESVKLAQRVGP